MKRFQAASSVEVNCGRDVLDSIQVIARTPWNQDIRGTWNGAAYIEFRADWEATGIDPLDVDAPAVVARPWVISGTQWTPSSAEAAAILKLIGGVTDTQSDLVRGSPPPKLEVTTFAVDGEGLHVGQPSMLVVQIANHGPGTAPGVQGVGRRSPFASH